MFRRTMVSLVVTALALGAAGSWHDAAGQSTPTPAANAGIFDPAVPEATPIPGVETFEVTSREHTTEPVDYPQDPPVGGPHNPVWQKCEVYEAPVQKEMAVHSIEHGAVWITYQPDLPDADRKALEDLAKDQPYVLVSPYPGLKDKAVASAWGVQLRVDDVHDRRLAEFIARYAGHGPEPGANCASGVEETIAQGG
jgi:hypothetical protein